MDMDETEHTPDKDKHLNVCKDSEWRSSSCVSIIAQCDKNQLLVEVHSEMPLSIG